MSVVAATVVVMGEIWHWGVHVEVAMAYAAMAVVGMAQVLRHSTTWVPEAHMGWLSAVFTLAAIMGSALCFIAEPRVRRSHLDLHPAHGLSTTSRADATHACLS